MNEKTLRALIEAGAIKKVRIIAEGSTIYVEADSGKQTITAKTVKGTTQNLAQSRLSS